MPSVRAPLRELDTRSAPAVPAASIRPSAWPPRPLLLAAWPIRTNQPIKCAHVRYRTHIHIKMVGDDIRDIRHRLPNCWLKIRRALQLIAARARAPAQMHLIVAATVHGQILIGSTGRWLDRALRKRKGIAE